MLKSEGGRLEEYKVCSHSMELAGTFPDTKKELWVCTDCDCGSVKLVEVIDAGI